MVWMSFLSSISLLLVGAFMSFLTALYWFKRTADIKEAERLAGITTGLIQRVVELEKQLSLVGQAVLPISAAFQAILIKELTHFHTPEMDSLMAHVGPPSMLTEQEETQLATLLEQRAVDMGMLITDSERDAARMLPLVMKRARIEAQVLAGEMHLKLVTVVPVAEEWRVVPNRRKDDVP